MINNALSITNEKQSKIEISNIAISGSTSLIPKNNKHMVNSSNRILLKSIKEPKVISFEEKIRKNPDLVTEDMHLPPPKSKDKEVIAFKKNNQINKFLQKSYAQRQSLVIPELPKERRPVDISKNIIENKIKPEVTCVGIQSDEFQAVNLLDPNNKNTNNTIYNNTVNKNTYTSNNELVFKNNNTIP